MTSLNSPLATFPRTPSPSPATPSLPVASGRYCLLFTSGVHRQIGLCEGRQSWTRPNDTQSVTSNCTSIDPVTRRLHRQQHLAPGSPTACKCLGFHKARPQALEPIFFANGAEGGVGPGASPGVPHPPPGPPRRLAAQGGKGGALHRPPPLPSLSLPSLTPGE
jgi:hypothetical protein